MAAGSELQEALLRTIHVPGGKEMLAAAKKWWEDLRIGDGHFTAWFRQGFKELTHLLLPAFPRGQHIVEEPGLWGNPTQGEVVRGREDQPSARQHVAALNEEPMPAQSSVRSPADLLQAKQDASMQGHQQPSRQEVSPADLVAARQDGPVQGQPQKPPDISPADLTEARGGPQPEPEQSQEQSHGLNM